jgi:hypothetical protein
MFRVRKSNRSLEPGTQTRRGGQGETTMLTDTNDTRTKVTVEHFLAGMAVWAVLMLVYAIF